MTAPKLQLIQPNTSTVQDFLNSWSPATPHEASLIKELASLQLRLHRCVRIETGLFDHEIREVAPTDSHESVNAALAEAFGNRATTFTQLSRYEATLSRAYDRTFKQLLAIRKAHLQPAPASSLDETKPMRVVNKGNSVAPKPSEPAESPLPDPVVPPLDPHQQPRQQSRPVGNPLHQNALVRSMSPLAHGPQPVQRRNPQRRRDVAVRSPSC